MTVPRRLRRPRLPHARAIIPGATYCIETTTPADDDTFSEMAAQWREATGSNCVILFNATLAGQR